MIDLILTIADQERIREAFEAGRLVGQREGFALQGFPSVEMWLPGVEFKFDTSWFNSFVSYERLLTGFLRDIQRARWVERREGVEGLARLELLGRRMPDGNPRALLEEHEKRIEAELKKARDAVDAELAAGNGRRCIVEAIRASPQRPATVTEFRSVRAFIADDPRRAASSGADDKAGGVGCGINWQLENAFRRWEITGWEMAWLGVFGPLRRLGIEATNEVYAIEEPPWDDGRVWVLGKLPTREAVGGALDDLKLHAMTERNSLAAAAAAVAAAMKDEAAEPSD